VAPRLTHRTNTPGGPVQLISGVHTSEVARILGSDHRCFENASPSSLATPIATTPPKWEQTVKARVNVFADRGTDEVYPSCTAWQGGGHGPSERSWLDPFWCCVVGFLLVRRPPGEVGTETELRAVIAQPIVAQLRLPATLNNTAFRLAPDKVPTGSRKHLDSCSDR
jgi:hypothetical protein